MRTRLLIKVFKLFVIYIAIFIALQLFIQQKANTLIAELPQRLFPMEEQRTYAQGIAYKNLSDSTIERTTRKIHVGIDVMDKTRGKFNNRWIVLLAVNYGFLDMFHNWFWYYQSHHINKPVVVVAEDDKIFHTLTSVYRGNLTIVRSNKNNTDSAVNFGSASFKKLVSDRPSHILRYLEMGNNVLYCDTDSVWLKNPFPYLVGDFDIWAQVDANEFCTGFLAIQSNARSLQFTKEWKLYMSQVSDINDQEGFNAVNKSRLRIKKLDLSLFPYGYLYFSAFNKTERNNTVVVHNNWIVGFASKVHRFKKFGLWRM